LIIGMIRNKREVETNCQGEHAFMARRRIFRALSGGAGGGRGSGAGGGPLRRRSRRQVPVEGQPPSGLSRLAAVRVGEKAVIAGFEAGHTLISRLSALGFTPGTEVRMIQNFGHGPVIVSVHETSIALGRGEASKVLVRAG
jgi:ferrous iron transport protein A